MDTGAVVNLVYSGVVAAFPELDRYRHPFHHVVQGVGQQRSKVVGKLIGVPIHIGPQQVKGQHVLTTFYVLDCPAYHWILGLPLLTGVDGIVHCRRQVLQYTLATKTTPLILELPLTPRAQVHHQPAYVHHQQFLASCTPPDALEVNTPHDPELPSGHWEAHLLNVEEAAYVGGELTDILGVAALYNEHVADGGTSQDSYQATTHLS